MKLPPWNLYFNSIKNNYFWVDNSCTCNFCKKIIASKEQVILREYWGKSYFDYSLSCLNCANKIAKYKKVKAKTIQKKVVFFLNNVLQLPKGSIIVCLQPPTFFNGRYADCFEAAAVNEPGVKVENKCRYAFDPNQSVMPEALEHKENVERQIEFLDNPNAVSTDREALDFLKSFQNAKPLLPEKKEIKRIK
jgi:hypothetical protein